MNGNSAGEVLLNGEMQCVWYIRFLTKREKQREGKKEKSCECGRGQCHRHVHTYTHGSILWAPPTLLLRDRPDAACLLAASRKVTTPATHLSFRLLHFWLHWTTTNRTQVLLSTSASTTIYLYRMRDGQAIGKRADPVNNDDRPFTDGHLPSFPSTLLSNIQNEVTRSRLDGVTDQKADPQLSLCFSPTRSQRGGGGSDGPNRSAFVGVAESANPAQFIKEWLVIFYSAEECSSFLFLFGSFHTEESLKTGPPSTSLHRRPFIPVVESPNWRK